MFPEDPVTFHVKTPREANRFPDPDLLCGLELETGRERLVVPAPRESWAPVTLDLRELFDEADIEVRPLRYQAHAFPLYEFPNTPLHLRPFAAARRRGEPAHAEFGEIRGAALETDPERLLDRHLEHPERWWMWRGDVNFEAGNYELARELYLETVILHPDFGPGHYRLAEAEFWLGRWGAAAASFERCLELGFDPANATKGIAWCRFNSGRLDEAEALFESALELFEARGDPDRDALHMADCHKGRWLVFLRRKDCAAAELARKEALALAPGLRLAASDEDDCP